MVELESNQASKFGSLCVKSRISSYDDAGLVHLLRICNFHRAERDLCNRARRACTKQKHVWKLGSWNARSMVDMNASIEVESHGTEHGEERRGKWIRLWVVGELEKYGYCGWSATGDQVVWS